MKFRNYSLIMHNGRPYEPGIVDLPKEVGHRLGLDPVDGPTKAEREAEEKEQKEKEQKEE